MSNAFPKAEIAFRAWDGDKAVWPMAVESADKEAWRLAFEIATMPRGERENLTLVGHSLGGKHRGSDAGAARGEENSFVAKYEFADFETFEVPAMREI